MHRLPHHILISLPILIAFLFMHVVACPRGQRLDDDEFEFTPSKEALQQLDEEGWEKFEGNPVFNKGERGQWDAAGVTCFVVRHFPRAHMMWYSASGQWTGFGLAQSRNGIDWIRQRSNPVMVPDSGVTVWGPEVLFDGELYHMWYVSRGPDMNGISHCTSEDGVAWIQSENNPVIDHGGCMAVIWDGEQYRMFLQVQGFQLATSQDGDEWDVQDVVFPSGIRGEWDEIIAAPSIAYYEDQLHLWYTGADTVGNQRGEIAIGHAASDDWGESWEIDEDRTEHRMLRPSEPWEGRGLYSSGVDFDGERIYIWYAATGPDGGFGFASRLVSSTPPVVDVEKSNVNLWSIAPNPTAGPVKINYLGTLDFAVSVGIFDMSGRQIFTRDFGPHQPIRIDPGVAGLPIGQYMLRINGKGHEVHKQVVLVK